MTHLPFIAAAYALLALGAAGLGLGAERRLRLATRRLNAVETRNRGER